MKQQTLQYILFATLSLLMAGCANRGVGPQGGPKDSIPPYVVAEDPINGALNYKNKKIEITLNEYIQLSNVVENVLISPPQQKPPTVKARGKKVLLTFEEELKDSTTYTIDFGAAICDFTEKNPLSGYSFSFSTGDAFDSLAIYGYAVNAQNLDPVQGLIVGIHPDNTLIDSVPFLRISKTDEDGAFAIRNIHEGTYYLYALKDNSRDYVYQPGEGLAWIEEPISPFFITVADTITIPIALPDSVQGDSLATTPTSRDSITYHNEFGPADIVLWYFEEDKKRQYFQRASRKEPHRIEFTFAQPQDSMPHFDAEWIDQTLWQYSQGKDTIICWLRDSAQIKQDSLVLQMTYLKSDSLYELYETTDTLTLTYRAPSMNARLQAAKEREARNRRINIKHNGKNGAEINDTLSFNVDIPIDSIYPEKIRLYEKKDTTYTELAYTLSAKDSAHTGYRIDYAYEPEKQYELRIDSAAMRDIYGAVNMATKIQTRLKSVNDYANIRIHVTPYDDRIRLQLLSEKDQVVKELPAQTTGTLFEHIPPKTYYLRIYIDENNDQHWTTGDKAKKRQPEKVYYFPAKLTLRANWDFDETFDYTLIDQLEAKPEELIGINDKNKKK